MLAKDYYRKYFKGNQDELADEGSDKRLDPEEEAFQKWHSKCQYECKICNFTTNDVAMTSHALNTTNDVTRT